MQPLIETRSFETTLPLGARQKNKSLPEDCKKIESARRLEMFLHVMLVIMMINYACINQLHIKHMSLVSKPLVASIG